MRTFLQSKGFLFEIPHFQDWAVEIQVPHYVFQSEKQYDDVPNGSNTDQSGKDSLTEIFSNQNNTDTSQIKPIMNDRIPKQRKSSAIRKNTSHTAFFLRIKEA